MRRNRLLEFVFVAAIVGFAVACSDAARPAKEQATCDSVCREGRGLAADRSIAIPLDTLIPLDLETYDGSGQAIHPDGLMFPVPLNGWTNGLLVTPYPNSEGRDIWENPSFYVSNNLRYWTTVTDTTKNPIARPSANTHLSDNAIMYDSAVGGLRVYYRETFPNVADRVYTKTTRNGGLSWSEPRLVLSGREFEFLSPTVAGRRMWYVHAAEGCNSTSAALMQRTSGTGEDFEAATTGGILQPGYVPWHVNIDYIVPLHEYVGLLAAYPADSATASGCLLTDVFLITSEDGQDWTTYRNPLLRNAYESAIVDFDSSGVVAIIYSIIERPFGRYSLAIGRHRWQDIMERVGLPSRRQ